MQHNIEITLGIFGTIVAILIVLTIGFIAGKSQRCADNVTPMVSGRGI